MVELTANERELGSAAVARALAEEGGPASHQAMAPAAGDLKKVFCENWDTVKSVLQFLSGFLPAALRPILMIVIKAGDALHAAICH